MSDILLIGKASRLLDEISFFLDSSSYHNVLVSPDEINYKLLNLNNISHVIINYEFPTFRGLDCIKKIKSIKELPIIIITSNKSSEFKSLILKSGVNRVITRPFRPKELVELIRH